MEIPAEYGTQIAIKDDSKIIQLSNDLVEQAQVLQINDDLSLNKAVELEKDLKLFLEGPGRYHDDSIDIAHKLHSNLCAKRNAIVDGVKIAWKSLKDRRATYMAEQERKRQEKQRAAEAEARRIEAEKQAKIQEKIDAENARLRKIKDDDERARAQEKIAALEEKKENVYVAPKMVAPVSVPTGASLSFTWDAEVVNKAVVPENYKIVDIAMLERMQKAAKGAMVVPGIRFTKRAVGSMRGGR